MRRATGALLSLALVLGGATAAKSESGIPAGYTVAARSELAGGIDYLKLTRRGPAEVAHVAHIAPGAPVDLRVVNAHDKVPGGPGDLETTSSMCRREHCVVGVNGDFHINGVPAGAVVTGGRMLHSPDPGRPQLTVTGDGRLVAGPLPWAGSFTFADDTELAVGAVNADPPAGGLALFTPDSGSATPASGRTELVVRTVRGPLGALNEPATVELQAVRSGSGPIPPDGAVLSADGAAAQQLLAAWGRKPNKASSRARLTVSSSVDAAESVGAYPVVLRDGKRALPWRDPNLVNPRQPHTLVGWNAAGDVYLVAVDGRQANAEGLTMAEAADFLVGLGVTDAVNLDGGGGTTFVADGSVRNRPSDDDPARPGRYFERGSANAFIVVARPGTAPPGPVTPSMVPTGPTPEAPSKPVGGVPGEPAVTSAPISDGGAGIDDVPGSTTGSPAQEPTVEGLPPDRSAIAAGSSSAKPRAGQQASPSPTGTEEVAAPASAQPDGTVADADKVTEVLRAPLAAASSITTGAVAAALGTSSDGLAPFARTMVTALAAVSGLLAIIARRRRPVLAAPSPEPVVSSPPLPVDPAPVLEKIRPAPAERAPVAVRFREVQNEFELSIRSAPVPRRIGPRPASAVL